VKQKLIEEGGNSSNFLLRNEICTYFSFCFFLLGASALVERKRQNMKLSLNVHVLTSEKKKKNKSKQCAIITYM
jgi:hypothetical protein